MTSLSGPQMSFTERYNATSLFPDRDALDPDAPPRETARKIRAKIMFAFLEATTLHGLGRVFTSRTKCFRFVWFLLFIAGFLYVSYGVYDSIKTYYSYPVNTKMRMIFEEKVTFPAVTICNRNKYVKSRALKKYPKLVGYYQQTGVKKKDVNISSEQMETIFEDIGSAFKETVVDCEWSTNKCPKAAFTSVVVENYGMCFTFNSGKDGQPVFTVSSAGRYFGLSVTLNLQVKEYLPAFSAGAVVTIHNQDEPIDVGSVGIAASPGTQTIIAVTKTRISSLKKPYETACEDIKLTGYKKYSRVACIANCFYNYVYKHCGCMKEGFIGPARMCSFYERVTCVVKYQLKFRVEKVQQCACPEPCESIVYEGSASQYAWPAAPYIKKYGYRMRRPNMTDKELKAYLRKNFLQIKVYFKSMHHHFIKQIPAYSSFTLFGDIGGLVGLFLGASFLTLFEFCELLIDLCFVERKKPRSHEITMQWRDV